MSVLCCLVLHGLHSVFVLVEVFVELVVGVVPAAIRDFVVLLHALLGEAVHLREVEVVGVALVLQHGQERRFLHFVQHLLHVDLLQPRVLLDFGGALRAQPRVDLHRQQRLDEVLQVGRDLLLEAHVGVADALLHDSAVLVREARLAHDEFVREAAHRPPVDRLGVALAVHEFGRVVLGRAANAHCVVLGHVELAVAEVCDFDVAVVIDEHVFGLEVALDDVALV